MESITALFLMLIYTCEARDAHSHFQSLGHSKTAVIASALLWPLSYLGWSLLFLSLNLVSRESKND